MRPEETQCLTTILQNNQDWGPSGSSPCQYENTYEYRYLAHLQTAHLVVMAVTFR
jgi:hypothetical protein